MDTAASEAVYQFEGFVLDLVRGALFDANSVEVPLRAKSFDLLRLFVTHAGRLLERDEINNAIWAEVIVTDDAITQCVRDIRRALGDEQQKILRTLPRRGYVLTASVTRGVGQRLAVPTAEPVPLPDKPSIAVLAFTNMSGDPEQEYFSDGIADEIITELSRSRALFVIARNSSFSYKARAVDVKLIARELGVRYVLEGSVRRIRDRVRVLAQLIDAETGNHIWAERYDRAMEDVFAVQDEIAEAVAVAIRPAVGDAEQRRVLRKPPDSLSAWEAYQRGLWHEAKHNATDNALARGFFQQAVHLDGAFAQAHAELAYTYLVDSIYETRSREEASALAMRQAEVALRIDPENAEANTARGVALFYVGDIAGAAICYDQALSIDPTSARARRYKASNLLFSGHPAQAREEFLAHVRINPRDVTAATNRMQIALSHYFERNYEAAADVAIRAIAAHPYHPHSYRLLVASLGQLGRAKEAAAALAKADEISPHPIKHYVSERPPWMRHEDYDHVLDGLRKAGWEG